MTTMETVTVKKARAIPFYNEAPLDVLPERVFVYRNLAKERATGETYYSVKNTRTGLIVAHVKNIALNNVTFVVQPAGRAKVLREKQKTVHAGLRGTPVKLDNSVQVEAGTYNPYKSETFVSRADLTPLTTAPYAHLDSNGVWFSV